VKTNSRWQSLITSGNFDENKAALSLKTGRNDIGLINPKSFADTLKGETPTLATIKKYQGESVYRAAIVHLVYWVKDNFNFGKNITNLQAETFADLLFDDFPSFTLADVKLCFKEGVKGTYGEIYQNIDPSTLFSWVKAYFDKKDEYLTVEIQKAQEEAKEEVKLTPEEVSEKWKKLREGLHMKQHSSIQYRSLIHYCDINDLDFTSCEKYLRERYSKQYLEEAEEVRGIIQLDSYIRFRTKQFLLKRSKRDEGKILENSEPPVTISLEQYIKQQKQEQEDYLNRINKI
jgi:hypothetical protein